MSIATFRALEFSMLFACVQLLAPAAGQGPAKPASAMPVGASAPVLERRGTELGFAVFQQHCVACHGNPAFERAPSPAALRAMTPERIYAALTDGMMKSVGDSLSEVDRRRVAESLAGQLLGSASEGNASQMPNRCSDNPPLSVTETVDWNGWGNGSANRRFQSADGAGLDANMVPRLKLKWAFGFAGGTSAFAQPSLVAGRVFVGSDTGYVYSLNAQSGCVYWSYRTEAGVRTAMTIGSIETQGSVTRAVFFGDLKATAYAIDAQSGRLIWKRRVDPHFASRVTAAPALYDGRLYFPVSSWEGFQARVLDYPCCTDVGSVTALDARSGAILWKSYTIAERPRPTHKNSRGVQQWAPAGVPVWNTPTVDPVHRVIYVGTGDASTYPAPATSDAILALDLNSGRQRWARQIYVNDSFIVGCSGAGLTDNCPKIAGRDWDIPMSPMLTTAIHGRSLLVFGTKPGDIQALDPAARGAPVWRVNVGSAAVGTAGVANPGPVWGGAVDDNTAYFGLNAGGVAAVSLADGQRVWYAPLNSMPEKKLAHAAAATLIPGVLFVAGSDGRLWALKSQDGKTLWSFDTARSFDTVNAVPAHGGSISAAGAVVGGGLLLIGSGYGVVGDTPGNVLLAFSVP
jgi:polyvinyl alcohol dehydrogenase (cytochrome)